MCKLKEAPSKVSTAACPHSHLRPGHNFKHIIGVDPADEDDEEQGRNGCQVPGIVEGVRDAQEPCPQAEVHHQKEPEKVVDGSAAYAKLLLERTQRSTGKQRHDGWLGLAWLGSQSRVEMIRLRAAGPHKILPQEC